MKWSMPTHINGIPVVPSGPSLAHNGGIWHTLVPENDEDDHLWEWDEVTNRLIVTRP